MQMRAQADASGGGLTCMLGEVVRLQRLPLAELLAAPVAALSAGALAGLAFAAFSKQDARWLSASEADRIENEQIIR